MPSNIAYLRFFRCQAAWIRDYNNVDVFNQDWEKKEVHGIPSSQLCRKIQYTKVILSGWKYIYKYGHCQARVDMLQQKLEQVQAKEPIKQNSVTESAGHVELN